jgi:hypothetical protein
MYHAFIIVDFTFVFLAFAANHIKAPFYLLTQSVNAFSFFVTFNTAINPRYREKNNIPVAM